MMSKTCDLASDYLSWFSVSERDVEQDEGESRFWLQLTSMQEEWMCAVIRVDHYSEEKDT